LVEYRTKGWHRTATLGKWGRSLPSERLLGAKAKEIAESVGKLRSEREKGK
jgi:hypothetical protein